MQHFTGCSSNAAPQGAMDSLTEAELMLYWVMPPPENRPHEVGKAMKMVYAHNQDSFLTQDLLMEMVCVVALPNI